jgi:xanthine/CO dehydrogenase XdhC/CoxF family maturation factor
MNTSVTSLLEFLRARVAGRQALALATVVGTEGSTYRKPGAQMLIGSDRSACGLLSGGCLEADLIERAQRVLATSTAEIVTYDARTGDDPVWGLGLGCEGAMQILLQRIDEASGYQPLAFAAERIARNERGAYALVVASEDPRVPVGTAWHSASAPAGTAEAMIVERTRNRARQGGFENVTVGPAGARLTAFIAALDLPPRILILGAGADAEPVVQIATLVGWRITVVDHRSAYLDARRFAADTKLLEAQPQTLSAALDLDDFDAAVVMSHHLVSDAAYLRALAASHVPYVGLLGPAARRRRLLGELGDSARQLGSRLYGPVGLDIGARTPEAIAVAIVAEIQAFLTGRAGESFRLAVQQNA